MWNAIVRTPCCDRYHEGGRLSDQQMALLQYQRENIHFLSEEVCDYFDVFDGSSKVLMLLVTLSTKECLQAVVLILHLVVT